jgi:tripartite-type tricarboxylate transporter receptor subunit TctC
LPLLAAAPGAARAEGSFPTRTIEMIVPVAVAGASDVVGRILADSMMPMLGKPVVIENIAGAASSVGATAFEQRPADGYTIYMATNNHLAMKAMYPHFRYDPVTDFEPLALVSRQPFMLAVNPAVPAHSTAELVTWLRQQGDRATFGASQPGGNNYLAGQMFRKLTGTDFTIVPYRGAAASAQDLAAGRLNLTIDSPTVLAPLAQQGLIRALAVSSGSRFALLPDLPTIAEGGVADFDILVWTILFTRVGTPPERTAMLRDVAARALQTPEVHARLKTMMCDTWPDASPAAALSLLKRDLARWTPIFESTRQAPG